MTVSIVGAPMSLHTLYASCLSVSLPVTERKLSMSSANISLPSMKSWTVFRSCHAVGASTAARVRMTSTPGHPRSVFMSRAVIRQPDRRSGTLPIASLIFSRGNDGGCTGTSMWSLRGRGAALTMSCTAAFERLRTFTSLTRTTSAPTHTPCASASEPESTLSTKAVPLRVSPNRIPIGPSSNVACMSMDVPIRGSFGLANHDDADRASSWTLAFDLGSAIFRLCTYRCNLRQHA
jgi:hypothetical protein